MCLWLMFHFEHLFDIMMQTVYVQNFIFHLYRNKLQLLYKVTRDQWLVNNSASISVSQDVVQRLPA